MSGWHFLSGVINRAINLAISPASDAKQMSCGLSRSSSSTIRSQAICSELSEPKSNDLIHLIDRTLDIMHRSIDEVRIIPFEATGQHPHLRRFAGI